jgi:hypothetical protein
MSRFGLFYAFRLIVLCVSLCSFVTTTSYAQDIQSASIPAHTMHGIYGLGPSPNVTDKSYVDGILNQTGWSEVEPQPGVFSWKAMDSWVAATTKAGKHFVLRVAAGIFTPQWVYNLGAASVQLSQGTVPIPWDPTYLQYFNGMVAAMGARYGSNPALDGVEMTGLNYATGETGLVTQKNVNDCAPWMQAGYTSSLVVSAFSQILTEFTDDFPNVQLATALVNGGFCASATTFDWTMNSTLIGLGGFVPQNNGWSSNYVMPNMTGDEEVDALGSSLPAALNLVLEQPTTRYLQIYDPDLWNSTLAPSITAARAVLLAR